MKTGKKNVIYGCLGIALYFGAPPVFSPAVGGLLDSTTLSVSASILMAAIGLSFGLSCPSLRRLSTNASRVAPIVALSALYYVACGVADGLLTLDLIPNAASPYVLPVATLLVGVVLPLMGSFGCGVLLQLNLDARSSCHGKPEGMLAVLVGMILPISLAPLYPLVSLASCGEGHAPLFAMMQGLISGAAGAGAPPWAAAETVTIKYGAALPLNFIPPIIYAAALLLLASAGGIRLLRAFALGCLASVGIAFIDDGVLRYVVLHSAICAAVSCAAVALIVVLPLTREPEPGTVLSPEGESTAITVAKSLFASKGLSRGETTAMELLVQGRTSSEIATILGKSASTVRNTQSHAYKKLGVSSAAELRSLLDARESIGPRETEGPRRQSRLALSLQVSVSVALQLPVGLAAAPIALGTSHGMAVLSCAGVLLGENVSLGKSGASLRRGNWALLGVVMLARAAAKAMHPQLALLVLGISAGVGGLVASRAVSERCAPQEDGCRFSNGSHVAMLFILGVATEESWRGAAGIWPLMPFLVIPVLGCCGMIIWSEAKSGRARNLIPALAVSALAASIAPNFVIAAVAFAVCLSSSLELTRCMDKTVWPGSFALGVIAGWAMGDICGAVGLGAHYSGNLEMVAASAAAISAASALWSIAVSLCYVWAIVDEVLMSRAQSISETIEDDVQNRATMALKARGLNQTQASVALLTALGYTRSGIADELCLSVGSVNSARAAIYRRLDVHKKDELRVEIGRMIGEPLF